MKAASQMQWKIIFLTVAAHFFFFKKKNGHGD